MTRQIIIPTSNIYQLYIPNELIGKKVEVLAFDIEETEDVISKKAKTIEDLHKQLDGCKVDLTDFVFNRNEANDYE